MHSDGYIFGKKNIVWQKIERLISMLLRGDDDLLDEALALVYPLFGDAELSFYNMGTKHIMASTALNCDVRDAIEYQLSHLPKIDRVEYFDKKSLKIFRPGIVKLCIVPLYFNEDKKTVFVIEHYSKTSGMSLEKLETLFALLTVIVRQYDLSCQNRVSLRLDSLTRLPSRDALTDRLKAMCENGAKHACLGIISLSNAAELNRNEGLAFVDGLIKGIGVELENHMPNNVYRLGGTKFAIVFSGELYACCSSLESIVDRILLLDKKIITSNVIAPLQEDAYKTLYVCESHLKTTKEDIVTVVRYTPPIDFSSAGEQVNDILLVKEPVSASTKETSYEENEVQSFSEEQVDTDEDYTYPTEIMDDDIPAAAFYQDDIDESTGLADSAAEINDEQNVRDSNNPRYEEQSNVKQTVSNLSAKSSDNNADASILADESEEYDFGFGEWSGREGPHL